MSVATCPHCAGYGIARIQLAEQTAAKLKVDPSSLGGRPWPSWLRAIIFLLSFPVVVPSLMTHWLMAKRWGRIPLPSILFDGLLLLLFCLFYPVLWTFVLLSMAATAVLFLRSVARGRADSGIFLGYSNMVAMPLILGGLLAIVGVIGATPAGTFRKASLSEVDATSYNVSDMLDEGVPVPKKVRIRDAELRTTDRVREIEGVFSEAPAVSERSRFAPREPGHIWTPVDQTNFRVWMVEREAKRTPTQTVQGLFMRVPPEMATSLHAFRPTLFSPTVPIEFVIIASSDLYELFGVVEPKGRWALGWLLLALAGGLLLVFATYRAVEEESE